ncbi:MAG: glycosyltransferase [Rhizobiaceae bacterium]|nr:glycosyltransferase [Rhizobiaceae bacterium]
MELARSGHDVSIYCLLRGAQLEREVLASGVKVRGIAQRNDPSKLSRPVRVLALIFSAPLMFFSFLFRRPTIVHFFLPESYLVGAMMARAAGLSRLLMSRRSLNNYQLKRPKVAALERKLHGLMTAILGNSWRVVEQLEGEGIKRGRLGLIYNGIDIKKFDQQSDQYRDIRSSFELDENSVVITIIANLIPYKGHSDLIEALASISNKMPANWALLVVGRDDGIGKDLAEQTKASGIADNVHFLGLREDVASILRASNIGVLCSHEEGFSNAILEGMAATLPMVVTEAGGNSEAVIDGVTGNVVPISDTEALGSAILKLASDPHLAKEMGVAGRQRVEQQFSLSSCVDRYEELYAGLMKGKSVADISGVGLEKQS